MTEQLLEDMLQDEYGYYTEEELKKNWIDGNKLEKIMIQLSRQALHQADIIYTQNCTINNLLKQMNKD